MCGRLFTEQDITLKAERFNLPIVELGAWQQVETKSDLPPGEKVLVVYKDRIQPTLWGWWYWQKGKTGKLVKRIVLNTRVETLFEKLEMGDPKYLDVISTGRALVLTNGFYEWPQKKKTLFKVSDGEVIALAALVFKSKNSYGTLVDTVSIITQPPSDDFAGYHDRMPIALPEDLQQEWLYAEDLSIPKIQSLFKSHLDFEKQ